MQDSFITIIAIFLAGIVLFIFPIMAVSERANDQAQAIVERAISDFVAKSATTGSIKLADYNTLLTAVGSTGNSYNIEMSVDRIGENIGKKTSWTAGDVVGENSKYTVYTDQITKSLNKNGIYSLNKGDSIKVGAKNTSTTMASSLRSMIFSISGRNNYEIVAEKSALVTATGGF